MLATFACHPGDTPRAAPSGERKRLPLAVPARPRPDHPFLRLSAAQAQDPGVRRTRGRLLPHPADPFDRGGAGGAHHRRGARLQRIPHRGGGAGPRSRPHPVRPHRRGRAEPAARPLRRLRSQRPGAEDRDLARTPLCRLRRAQPHLGEPRGDRQAQRSGDRRSAGGAGRVQPARTIWNSAPMPAPRRRSPRLPTTSPTTTTTCTTGCAPGCSRSRRSANCRSSARPSPRSMPPGPGSTPRPPPPRGPAPRLRGHGRRCADLLAAVA